MGLEAFALYKQNRLAEAEELQSKVLKGRKKLHGDSHYNTIIAMNNLADTLRARGDLERAKKLQSAILDVAGSEGDPNHYIFIDNNALTLREQGEFKKAEELHRRAIKGLSRLLGSDHPSTLTAMENLSVTLTSREQYDEARSLQEHVFMTRKAIFGLDNKHTIRAGFNLLVVFSHLEDAADALDFVEEHLTWLQERIPGSLRPDQRELQALVPKAMLAIGARPRK